MVTIDDSYQEIPDISDPQLKREYWDTAKGLQAVDGLKTSAYLETLIEDSVNNTISSAQVIEKLQDYYGNGHGSEHTREADYVSARIEQLLEQQQSFVFSPLTLKYIHRELFKDVLPFDWVGEFRQANIAKSEDVLCGESVSYAPYSQILELLEYDFSKEEKAQYSFPFDEVQIAQLADFVSNVWETHPFREGNTRTIAVFVILYLNNLGYSISNEPFKDHSQFLRDALVRNVYANARYGVHRNKEYLIRFFENVLLGASHTLVSEELYCPELKDLAESHSSAFVSLSDALQDSGLSNPESTEDVL